MGRLPADMQRIWEALHDIDVVVAYRDHLVDNSFDNGVGAY